MKKGWSSLKNYLKERNRFIIQNPITFQQKLAITLSRGVSGLLALALLLVFGALIFIIISFTSLKYAIPGYPVSGSELYRVDRQNQEKLNDIAKENKNRQLWIANLSAILNNTDSVTFRNIQENLNADSNFNYKSVVFERPKEDSILRKKVKMMQTSGKYSLSKKIMIESLDFEFPKGQKFRKIAKNGMNHLAISAKKKSKINSLIAGKVLFTTDNSLVIQHSFQFTSIYSGIEKIEVEKGQTIKKGTQIGVSADTSYRYELWHKDISLPSEVITE